MSSDQAPIGRMPLKAESVRGAAEEKAARRVEDARAAEPVPERKRAPVPAAEDPFRPITERRPDEDSPRPQAPRPSERPRGTQQAPHKQKDAGAGEMRRSAAMGEDYLNQLLVGGLLSVPNVEAREHAPDAEERRRWRKKTRNAFILLWVLLILGAGGVGGYMFYARKRANEAVAKHLDAARTLMASGRQLDLARADGELQAALRVKGGDHLSLGTMAEERSLQLLWFGAGNIADVDAAVSAAGARLRDLPADAPGRREYAIGRVASLLAVLDRVQDPQQAIGEARKELDGALKAAPGDGMLLYLDGALRLALGDREGARASFEKSDTGGKGPPAARIAIGDLLLDSGDPEGAQQAYEAALGRSPQHPMALVGRALARVERSTDAEAAMQDLNVGLAGATGVRTEAWKHLAMSVVWAQLEDYDKSSKELDQAQQAGLGEPRFLARIALELLDRGKVTEAGLLRQKVHYFGEAPGRDPLMLLLDAELFMATGMPEDARAAVGENPTLRGHLVKGRALIDLGRPKDALAEFDAMLKIAPDDQLGKAYRELAVVLVAVAPGGDKSKGDASFENLAKMARSSVSGQVRYVFGEANLARGNVDDARRNFEASLEGENPLGYRARTRLAEVFLAAGRDDDAEKTLRDALDQSPVYAPARAALGRLLLKKGKIAEGVQELEPAVSAGRASAADELAYAGALVQLGRKDEAKAPLKRAKDKGAAPADLAAIAVQIDPAFVTELGLDGVKPPPGKKGGGK
jgi:tetratricopeptide (TPR) repeat protein